MKLSVQAGKAIMMALQVGMMESRDISEIILGFELEDSTEGLYVTNPPIVEWNKANGLEPEEEN